MAQNNAAKLGLTTRQHSCGTPESYNDYFDAYFCKLCDTWMSAVCGEHAPECWSHCAERPEKPSQTDR